MKTNNDHPGIISDQQPANMNAVTFSYDRFIVIPEQVYADDKLADFHKLLFGLILSLSRQRGYCFASNTTLGNKLNKSTTTVSRGVSKLEERGHITIKNPQSEFRRIFIST